MAMMPIIDVEGDQQPLPSIPVRGTATVSMLRVGSSQKLALLYALPLLAAAGFAAYLLARVPWAHTERQSTKMRDLVALGQRLDSKDYDIKDRTPSVLTMTPELSV